MIQDRCPKISNYASNVVSLRLQSSTSVYTKKVEYLRALAYEALNSFVSSSGGRSLDEGYSQVTKSGRNQKSTEDWDISDTFNVPYHALVRMRYEKY